jgi:protein SCO1/2
VRHEAAIARTAILAMCLALVACASSDEPLPSFGVVPELALRDQQGRAITRATFAGKIWIADFIFTSCPDVCPLLTEQLAGLRKRLPADPRLVYVSFSVDPEHDTPEKLAAFATAHGARAEDWYFLTGGIDDVKRVVTGGFKQAMDLQPTAPDKPRNVLHGTHYVLVDGTGTIRGFHRSDKDGMAELEAAVKQLLKAKG